eukprot:m.49304 g.49304  ORF g.49304 m.49304 type:complete len:332 (+) comp10609_c0_seq2:377-1372(+)
MESSTLQTHPALFNGDVLFLVFSFLDAKDLLIAAQVCQQWRDVASTQGIWDELCEKLWSDKVYVPEQIKKLRKTKAKEAYLTSIKDSKRCIITNEELCSFEWNHRMKLTAGEMWMQTDPWWNRQPPRRNKFFMDNTVASYTEVDGEVKFNKVGKWRFIGNCNDLGERAVTETSGGYLRLHIAPIGREVPTQIFFRHNNWGFYTESCWSMSTGFPMPAKGEDPSLEDENLKITVEDFWPEAQAYNLGLPLPEEVNFAPFDSDSDNDSDNGDGDDGEGEGDADIDHDMDVDDADNAAVNPHNLNVPLPDGAQNLMGPMESENRGAIEGSSKRE